MCQGVEQPENSSRSKRRRCAYARQSARVLRSEPRRCCSSAGMSGSSAVAMRARGTTDAERQRYRDDDRRNSSPIHKANLQSILFHRQAYVENSVIHEESGHRGSFFIERDGERLAEMTYSRASDSLVIIDHTEVAASLSGQGVGRRLLDIAVEWARETHTKILTTCPFARAQFAKDPSIRDVHARWGASQPGA